MSIVITIKRRGVPARRIVGIWPSTSAAVLSGIDLADSDGHTGPVTISVKVLA